MTTPSMGQGDAARYFTRVEAARRRRQGRWMQVTGIAAVVVVVLVIAGAVWIGVTGSRAKSELTKVRVDLNRMRQQISSGDFADARTSAAQAAKDAHNARELTSGPAWWAGSKMPGVGSPLVTARGVASAADQLATRVLPALIRITQDLQPERLQPSAQHVDLDALRSLNTQVSSVNDAVTRIQQQVHALPAHTWLTSIDHGRADLVGSIDALNNYLSSAGSAAAVATDLLGANGPKRYFVGFLNDAEARGLGGLPGAFGILVANHGRIRFTHFGKDNELLDVPSGTYFGPAYEALYGEYQPTTQYLNSTTSPNFLYTARIWAGMWLKHTGQRIDGAIAIDPTALSYLLAATGPAHLPDGTTISAENVVELTQSTAYLTFGDNQSARKQFLLDIAKAAESRVLEQHQNLPALLKAMGRAAGERRLLVWSADPKSQAQLERWPVAGLAAPANVPSGRVVINDYAADKLNYYLHSSVRWERSGCSSERDVKVTITLTNDAPASGLTKYVTGRNPGDPHAGDSVIRLDYQATSGAVATGMTVNGTRVPVTTGTELGHPVYGQILKLARGATRTVVLTLVEPAGTGAPRIVPQPMVNPMTVSVVDARCS
jgi:Protein of unknown function (DUF4012)